MNTFQRHLPFLFRTATRLNSDVTQLSTIRNIHLSCTTPKDDRKNDDTDKKEVLNKDVHGNNNWLKSGGKNWNETVKTPSETDGESKKLGKESDKIIPKENNKGKETVHKSRSNNVPTLRSSIKIYDHIPDDAKELFFKQQGERFRYRHLNEKHKKELETLHLKEKSKLEDKQKQNQLEGGEIEQIHLKEKTKTVPNQNQNRLNMDRNIASPVFLNKMKNNVIFDEKLDSMVKNLISETKSVLTKMVGINTNPSEAAQKTFEEVKDAIKMGATPFEEVKDAIKMAATSKGKEQSNTCSKKPSKSNNDKRSSQNGGASQKPPGGGPPDSNCVVNVSPFVDNQGNIDYNKAVIKSSCGGDTAARDMLAKLIQDPVKPLPTFELVNIPVTSETMTIGSKQSESTEDWNHQPVECSEHKHTKESRDTKDRKTDCKRTATVGQPCKGDSKQDPCQTKSEMQKSAIKHEPCVQKQSENDKKSAEMTKKTSKLDCSRKVESELSNKPKCPPCEPKPKPPPCAPKPETKPKPPPCAPKPETKPPCEPKPKSKPPCEPKPKTKPPCEPKHKSKTPCKPKSGTVTTSSEGKIDCTSLRKPSDRSIEGMTQTKDVAQDKAKSWQTKNRSKQENQTHQKTNPRPVVVKNPRQKSKTPKPQTSTPGKKDDPADNTDGKCG